MRKLVMLFWVMLVALSYASASHAAILHYSVSGIMNFTDTNWDNGYSTEIFGDMYISGTSAGDISNDHYARYEIVSFAITAGEYGWGGSGVIVWDDPEARITLDGTGDWDMQTGLVEGNYHDLFLPTITEVMDWPGFGWYFGEEYFSRIVGLRLTAVPIPSAVWLFGSGLIGLVGLARRKTSA